jgi:hypothetical protein
MSLAQQFQQFHPGEQNQAQRDFAIFGGEWHTKPQKSCNPCHSMPFHAASSIQNVESKPGWWFGTCLSIFPIKLGMSSSQLTNSIIFQRGGSTTNQ